MALFDAQHKGHINALELERTWFQEPLQVTSMGLVVEGKDVVTVGLEEAERAHLQSCQNCGKAVLAYTEGEVTPPKQPQPASEVGSAPVEYSI